jgi:hypothetical protein
LSHESPRESPAAGSFIPTSTFPGNCSEVLGIQRDRSQFVHHRHGVHIQRTHSSLIRITPAKTDKRRDHYHGIDFGLELGR